MFYQVSLGPLWPLVKLPGLWALVWSPREGVQDGRILSILIRLCKVPYLGLLDPTWPLVKLEISSKIVVLDMESRAGGAVWGCWVGLKDFSVPWIVSYLGSLGPA